MNPKKPKEEKSKNSGISLEPNLTKETKALAKRKGFSSLSAYARKLFTDALEEAAKEAEKASKKLEEMGQQIERPRNKKP